jgi:hypothetical protein
MATTSDDEEIEFTVFNKRESKVYQIPPAASADGHRAQDWKESIWIGRCRVVGKGKTLTIRLQDADSDALFAQCVIPNGEHEKYVEPVLDSSRYSVLKIANDQRHTFVGFGFSDRNDAFDFKSCLNDFRVRFVEREQAENCAPLITPSAKNLSLKEGQTITLNLAGAGSSSRRTEDKQSATMTGGIPLLAPPPKVEKAPPKVAEAPQTQGQNKFTSEFRPVPPREKEAPKRETSASAPPANDMLEGFADFQSATVPDRVDAKAEIVSSRPKAFFEYLLPMNLLSACSVDTRTTDSTL